MKIITIVNLLFFFFNSFSFSREIIVNVTTNWKRRITDPLIEISEFISSSTSSSSSSSSSSSPLFQYYFNLCSSSLLIDQFISINNEESYQQIKNISIHKSETVLSKNNYKLMKTVLNLNMYAPVNVFFNSLTEHLQSPCGIGQSFLLIYPEEIIYCNLTSKNKEIIFSTLSSTSFPSSTTIKNKK